MLRLSAKTEYALRAMIDLAMHASARTTLPAIAERQGIPRKFMPAILESLIQAGLVHTIRGYGGGIQLVDDPGTITIRQIIEYVEGPQKLVGRSTRGSDHPLYDVLDRADMARLDVLGSVTLADLMPKDGVN